MSAVARLIQLRHDGHKAFDRLWKSGLMNRREAYRLLSKWMGINEGNCHFSCFSAEQCQQAIDFCRTIDAQPFYHPRLARSIQQKRNRLNKREVLERVAKREARYAESAGAA